MRRSTRPALLTRRRGPAPTRILAALAALVAAALWAAAGAAPAAASITDAEAEPSHSFIFDGGAHGEDHARDVVIGDGVTYVVGTGSYNGAGYDATLTRISHTTWTATTTHSDSKYHAHDTAVAVALGPDGSIYTAGSTSNGVSTDMLVIKWAKTGGIVWLRRYDGPLKGNDRAVDIGVDRDGNVVVCGESQGAHGLDWAVVSWTKKGVRRYAWRYAGSGDFTDLPTELLIDRKGRVYVTGTVFVAGPKSAACLVKLSKAGTKQWVRTYTGPIRTGAAAYGIAADPAGGVFVAGYAETASFGRDAMVARYSAAGARTGVGLQHFVDDDRADVLTDVVVTRLTKHVIGVGYSSRAGEPTDPFQTFFFRENLAGSAVQFFTASDDMWFDVAADPFGGFVMAGSIGNTGTDFHTRRQSTFTGGLLWQSRWEAPVVGSVNQARAVDARGGITVSVGAQYSGAATDYDQLALFWVH
jgi:hypothetical protein